MNKIRKKKRKEKPLRNMENHQRRLSDSGIKKRRTTNIYGKQLTKAIRKKMKEIITKKFRKQATKTIRKKEKKEGQRNTEHKQARQ